MSYTTASGEVLNQIVHAHYGSTAGLVERVLEENPGLAAQPVELPAGLEIELPPPPAPAQTVDRLWN